MTAVPDTNTRSEQTPAEAARCLDEALEDTFPASDPPSMTSPTAATPAEDTIADGPGGAPMRVYRVIDARQASEPFAPQDGGGRWSPPGVPCVYAALSPAGAVLEYLAHLEGEAPDKLLLAVATVPAGNVVSETNEPSTWCDLPYRHEVQQVGAGWIESGRSLALRVPSALSPGESNVLLNPRHEGFAGLELQELRPVSLDPRLLS
jgi:RES domain-containing protein